MSFSIERFVSLSKAVDTSDIDWDYVARVGVSDDEARVLRYMADTESHTIIYMRDLLAGHTARDPEIAAFMSCWVYEEFNHGRAIDRFLAGCGRAPSAGQYTKVAESASWVEGLEAMFTLSLPHLTPHFAAVHMAWGAIDEMMAAMAYVQLSQYTRNKELAKLLLRMAKDERRHQAFYFHQAERRMRHPLGQVLARLGLEQLWSPVGIGVGGDSDDLAFIAWMLLDSQRGRDELRHNDRIMGRLPGMSGCSLSFRRVDGLMRSFQSRFPQEVERLRAQRRELGINLDAEPALGVDAQLSHAL